MFFLLKKKQGYSQNLDSSIKLLKRLKTYDLLIFNTASSSKLIRNTLLLLNLYPKIKCIGLLHNSKKIESSFTQKIISTKIKKYFVLADHLKQTSQSKIKLESFYPIFFPTTNETVQKNENEIWVVIPGRIDFLRRDYMLLLNSLEKIKTLSNIKFIFLGKLLETTKEGNALLLEFKNSKFQNQIIFFNRFIENEKYQAYLSKADMIMPLLKCDTSYLQNKISGSFNLAYAHKKALLSQEFFNQITDFSGNTMFFNRENLHNILEDMDKRKMKCPTFEDLDKWSFKNQKENYLNFLRSN
ncbi:hypothetical protein ACU8V7_04950 [Zobellia nedashkovskayae]